MAEIVTLVGGPRDGERMAIAHGNSIVIYLAPPMTMRIAEGTPDAVPKPEAREYVRSPKNPTKFIFKPASKDGIPTEPTDG